MDNELEIIKRISSLVKENTVSAIVKKHNDTKEQKKRNAYNLFSLSTYTSHLENFHSDLIASFLDVNGLHDEGNRFLKLFIKFLNQDYNCGLNIEDFEEAEVLREKGHIDIWIKNETTGKAILVENKMNNAGDREGQINDYHEYSQKQGNCKVEAIVYLSLDGFKPTPVVNFNIEKLIQNIGAFTNLKGDLVRGWLLPCLNACTHDDTSSLLRQYIKLICHLSSKQMDLHTLEAFYDFINKNQAFETISSLIELNRLMPKHRTNTFVKQITDIKPFTYSCRWSDNYMLYDYYRENQNSFKMDINFKEELGDVSVAFWNPPLENQIGFNDLTKKLIKINMLNEFEVHGTYSYIKFFRLGEDYSNLSNLDKAVVSFVNKFLLKLRESAT